MVGAFASDGGGPCGGKRPHDNPNNHCPPHDAGARFRASLLPSWGGLFDGECRMKRLTIVAEMPEAAGKALAYGNEELDVWAETALACALECDCDDEDTSWPKDVERLFGFRYEDARDAFNVVEARIEDMDGPEKEPVPVELGAEEWARLAEVARASGETPKACFTRLVREWLAEVGAEV